MRFNHLSSQFLAVAIHLGRPTILLSREKGHPLFEADLGRHGVVTSDL